MSELHRIRAAIEEFKKENEGRRPAKIHLTTDQEMNLQKLGRRELGGVAQAVMKNDIREVLTHIDGIPVMWDAKEFLLE